MASKEIIRRRVMELAKEATEVAGVELAGLELLGQRGRMLLRVTIDSHDGISIKDCEWVSRQIEALLDIEDLIQGSYNIEVTSPGLDRPLNTIQDFRRFKGRLARVITKEKIGKQSFFIGRIKDIEDDSVVLELEKGEIELPFVIISKARLEVEV